MRPNYKRSPNGLMVVPKNITIFLEESEVKHVARLLRTDEERAADHMVEVIVNSQPIADGVWGLDSRGALCFTTYTPPAPEDIPNKQVALLRAYLSPPFDNLDPVVRDHLSQTWDTEIARSYTKRLTEVVSWWEVHIRDTTHVKGVIWREFVDLLKSAGASFNHFSNGPYEWLRDDKSLAVINAPGNRACILAAEGSALIENHEIPPPVAIALFLCPTCLNPDTDDELVADAVQPEVFGCDPKWWET